MQPLGVAAGRREILRQNAPRIVFRRPVALPVALGQMVGVVRFELSPNLPKLGVNYVLSRCL
jgi:hypothetical protein